MKIGGCTNEHEKREYTKQDQQKRYRKDFGECPFSFGGGGRFGFITLIIPVQIQQPFNILLGNLLV
jgi:hypothetical protein